MMTLPNNIEKSRFHAGEYVGYGDSRVWRIWREGKQWHAYSHGFIRTANSLSALASQLKAED